MEEMLSVANRVLVVDYSSGFIGASMAEGLAGLGIEAYSIEPKLHLLPLLAPGDIFLILYDHSIALLEPIEGNLTELTFGRASLSPCI